MIDLFFFIFTREEKIRNAFTDVKYLNFLLLVCGIISTVFCLELSIHRMYVIYCFIFNCLHHLLGTFHGVPWKAFTSPLIIGLIHLDCGHSARATFEDRRRSRMDLQIWSASLALSLNASMADIGGDPKNRILSKDRPSEGIMWRSSETWKAFGSFRKDSP